MPTSTSPVIRYLIRATAAALSALLMLGAGAAWASYPTGVDTSRYQHTTSLRWDAVKASGVKFAFLKATEGSTWTDPYFAADWAATGKVGIYHGAYHFARPSVGSARSQARYFASRIGAQNVRGTLPPVLDLEATGGLTPSQLITWTRTWLTTVQQLTGRNPMIYVSPSFWRDHLRNSTGFHDYPLWIANYGVSAPSVPGGWPRWSFWQTTSSARVTGISGNVDKDVFNGSLVALRKFALDYDPAPTALSLTPSNPAPMSGDTVTFSGTLTNSAGAALAGKAVALSSQLPGSTTWTPVGTATTNAAGAYSLDAIVPAAAGYRATFTGNADLASSTSPTATLTLTPIPTTLTLAPSSSQALAGTTVTLAGALLLPSAQALGGQTVTVSRRLAGTTTWRVLAKPVTDETGGFALDATMMETASYRVRYAGSEVYAAAATPAQAVTVTLNPTALSFQVDNAAPYAFQRVRMSGTLVNDIAPVAGRAVSVERQLPGSTTWTSVGTATTDAAGGFATLLPVDQAGSYRAVFAADSLYAASASDPATVAITPPQRTRLTMTSPTSSPQQLTRGSTAALTGTLFTAAGKPVAGRSVGVFKRLAGTTQWRRVGRTTVAADGSWHATIRPWRSAWFRVAFAGGPVFGPAHSAQVRFRVH